MNLRVNFQIHVFFSILLVERFNVSHPTFAPALRSLRERDKAHLPSADRNRLVALAREFEF